MNREMGRLHTEASHPSVENSDFSFAADDVLKNLRSNQGTKLEYIGSATSDFQAQPLIFGVDGKPLIMSDWEMEVVKNLKGEPNKIQGQQDQSEFPAWQQKIKSYVQRSSELGENMFRFSLDFARLCPQEGEFNTELMADYVKALALIKAHGQEPMLTIYHWPMPKYLLETDKNGEITAGGWEHPEVAKHFRYYVENVAKFLGDENKIRDAINSEGLDKQAQDKIMSDGLVRHFVSINEPNSIILGGYIAGIFPPYKKFNVARLKNVMGKLVEAHDITYDQIKNATHEPTSGGKEAAVGLTYNWQKFEGALGKIMHRTMNEYPADSMERAGMYTDFLGLDYYCRIVAPSLEQPFGRFKTKGKQYSEHPGFGDVYPAGVYDMLKTMNERYPQKEIFITEFGFAEKKDQLRPYWILETIRYVLEARKQGIPIKGMLQWSLVNNFEWNLGMSQKFGMFDESDLSKPLTDSQAGQIKGWEAWRATAKAINNPSPENLQELQDYYETAKEQYNSNAREGV